MSELLPGPATPLARPQGGDVLLPWLVRLRWASVLALALAVWASQALWHLRIPTLPLVLLLLAMAATNVLLVLQLRAPAPRRQAVGAVLLLDVGLLTGIIALLGGPLNPFSIVYLVGITIAAVALGHRWAITIAAVSTAAYGVTFLVNRPLEFAHPMGGDHTLTLHTTGMWAALAGAGGLIAHFVSRFSEALEVRERELAQARVAAARGERLAALLSLGAGAAHELATPLSTISTAAGELQRTLHAAGPAAPDACRYIDSIRSEVDRCTRVLDQLSGRATPAAASDTAVPLPRLLDDVQYRLGESLARRLDIELPAVPRAVVAPAEPLRQTLIALLRNAFDASRPDQRVALRIDQARGLRLEIVDHGRGMTAEEAARAGEPFFTTKGRGNGLGLGLFLARAFAEQMGGSLQWHSAPGAGTSVTLDLPAH